MLAILGFLVAVAGPPLALYPILINRMDDNLRFCEKLADYLENKGFQRRYSSTLNRVLGFLDRWMGRELTGFRAFTVCLTLAFFYSFLFLLVGWVLGGSGTVGSAKVLPEWESWPFRLTLALGVPAYVYGTVRLLRTPYNPPNQLFGAIGILAMLAGVLAVAGLVAGSIAGAVAGLLATVVAGAGFLALAGVLAGAEDGAKAWCKAGTIALVLAIATIAFHAGATAGLATGTLYFLILYILYFISQLKPSAVKTLPLTGLSIVALSLLWTQLDEVAGSAIDISIVLFCLLLPLLNVGWDWISWGVSRKLGRHLVETLGNAPSAVRLYGTIGGHAAIDLIVAAILLCALSFSLPLFVEGWNLVAEARGVAQPLPLDGYLQQVIDHPESHGLWIVLMLFSTLIPTFGHFIILAAGVLMSRPGPKRLEIASRLRQPDHDKETRHEAATLTILSGMGIVGIVGAVGGGAVALVQTASWTCARLDSMVCQQRH